MEYPAPSPGFVMCTAFAMSTHLTDRVISGQVICVTDPAGAMLRAIMEKYTGPERTCNPAAREAYRVDALWWAYLDMSPHKEREARVRAFLAGMLLEAGQVP